MEMSHGFQEDKSSRSKFLKGFHPQRPDGNVSLFKILRHDSMVGYSFIHIAFHHCPLSKGWDNIWQFIFTFFDHLMVGVVFVDET
jgi:hypothetical protein